MSGHAGWDDLAAWWLSRYKVSTQQTYACYLPRWTAWCAGCGLDPLQAGRADVELWLRSVAGSALSRASVAARYDVVASIYRLALDEDLIAVNPCARITRPKVPCELQRREVLTVLEYAAFLTAPARWGRPITPSPCSEA
jgi:integrase/recombinase XerD